MPTSKARLEVVQATKGLNTDASPLNYPQGFSLDEKNFVLNKNGLRTRRLGMDLEDGHIDIPTSIALSAGEDMATGSFVWDGPGGDATKKFIVVQIGNSVYFVDSSYEPLRSGAIAFFDYPTLDKKSKISFASVDSFLVAATGEKEVDIFVYDSSLVKRFQQTLKVRDFFGVTDIAITNA